jgi:hypothetical protein
MSDPRLPLAILAGALALLVVVWLASGPIRARRTVKRRLGGKS